MVASYGLIALRKDLSDERYYVIIEGGTVVLSLAPELWRDAYRFNIW